MGFGYWFRVSMMCVALIGVIYVMQSMNQQKRPGQKPNALLAFFSGDPNAADVNLCPTRVTRLEAGKVSIFQEGLEWYRTTESERQRLDPVAVEKWFSSHCAQEGKKTSASADVKEALKVFFVSGEPQILLKSSSGEFEWMGQPFQSEQMDRALNELGELPAR